MGSDIFCVYFLPELPSLLNFEKEKRKMEKLDEENMKLKEQMAVHQKELIQLHNQMKAGKITTSTQTIDFIELNGETTPR